MNTTLETPDAVRGAKQPPASPSRGQKALKALSFRNIGAVYVLALIVVVFAIWIPSTFATWQTAKQILNGNAATGLMALALIIPLCTRTFDLSIGFVATLGAVISTYAIAHGVPVAPAIALAIGAALVVGVVNAVVVVGMGVDSFIATLATGSLIQAFISLLTNEIPITDARLATGFSHIGQTSVAGISLPVLYVVVVAVVLWFVLEHTATGRRLYATGFNIESARLAGVKVARLRFVSLVVSAGIAGVAGIVIASTLGTGDPTAGSPYLLSAYAAAFVGASQLRPGRFNAWGALIAVLLLGTGTTGLSLAGTENWTHEMFTGVVLIAALGITGAERRALRRGWKERFARERKTATPVLETGSSNGKPPLSRAGT
jgi:ribose transport system permease protein